MFVSLTKKNEQEYSVVFGRKEVGSIKTYINKFHARNCYLQLDLENYDTYYAKELFTSLEDEIGCSMQVMLPSTEQESIDFLEAGGFRCARKCYEMEVVAKDLVAEMVRDSKFENDEVGYCSKGSQEYDLCCQLMFEYYSKVHKYINPLTAEYEEFVEILPSEAMYQRKDGEIFGVAFIEENEIAYVGAKGADGFTEFLKKVVDRLFEKYDRIIFECDDCDPAAMELRGLFKVAGDESNNTYIRNYIKTMPAHEVRDELIRRRI